MINKQKEINSLLKQQTEINERLVVLLSSTDEKAPKELTIKEKAEKMAKDVISEILNKKKPCA